MFVCSQMVAERSQHPGLRGHEDSLEGGRKEGVHRTPIGMLPRNKLYTLLVYNRKRHPSDRFGYSAKMIAVP